MLGMPGENCDSACAGIGGFCDAKQLVGVDSKEMVEQLAQKVGTYCLKYKEETGSNNARLHTPFIAPNRPNAPRRRLSVYPSDCWYMRPNSKIANQASDREKSAAWCADNGSAWTNRLCACRKSAPQGVADDACQKIMNATDGSVDLLKKSYRKLAAAHHPDKNPGNEEKFHEIVNNYETCLDSKVGGSTVM